MRLGCGCLLFILLVLPLLFVFILLAGINTWVLDRGFYQQVLSEPAFYEAALDEAVINWSGAGLSDEFGDAPPVALNAGMRALMTPEYLQEMASATVDQVFDVLEGNAASFNLVFNLAPIKAALQGDGAADFADAYVGALPACRANEMPLPADNLLPVCRPSDVSEAEFIAEVTEALPAAAERLPDELIVDRSIRLPDVGGRSLPTGSIRTLMTTGLVIFGVVALLIWFIDAFIIATQTRTRFLWLGMTLLIPAVLVLLMGLGLNTPTLEGVIRESIARSDGVRDAQLATTVATTAINATAQIRTGFLVAGGIPTLVAALLLIVGLTLRPVDKRKNGGHYVQVPAR